MATSLRIDDALKGRVHALATQLKRSSHQVMIDAIREYVDREEARESFRREALASWAAYRETGLHLTGDEVQAWLRTWGTEAETAAPQRHE